MAKRKGSRAPTRSRKAPAPTKPPRGSRGVVRELATKEEIAATRRLVRDRIERAGLAAAKPLAAQPHLPKFSPFKHLASDTDERYKAALKELRASGRHGFDARDGYNLRDVGKLTENQRRVIRRAFTETRERHTGRSHTVVKRSDLPKGTTPAEWDAFLAEQGQRGGSKKWDAALVPVPETTARGERAPVKVVRGADGKLALEQRGIVRQKVRLGAGLFREDVDPVDYVTELVKRKAPDADQFRLLFKGGREGIQQTFSTPHALGQKIHHMIESDEYGEPEDFLVGFIAYTDNRPLKEKQRHRYTTKQHAAMETEKRVLLTKSKSFWKRAHEAIAREARGLRKGLKVAGQTEAQISDRIERERAHALDQARITAHEQGFLSEDDIYKA